MAATGHGATFTFTSNRGTIRGGVTKISVETPTAEIADATGLYDATDMSVMVPTGSWKGGSISVEFIASTGAADVQAFVRGIGQLSFASPGFSVTKRAILESASSVAAVGDVVRGNARFVMTDWYGN